MARSGITIRLYGKVPLNRYSGAAREIVTFAKGACTTAGDRVFIQAASSPGSP